MRDQLLGYLIGALDSAERTEVEKRLSVDPTLAHDLKVLRRSLAPLDCALEVHEPPGGLATRTCRLIALRRSALPLSEPLTSRGQWGLVDFLVAAGIFVAATLLLFPALARSRQDARRLACQSNLKRVGEAIFQYSQLQRGYLPFVPEQGPLSVAGIYGPLLLDHGFLDNPGVLLCPASARKEPIEIPKIGELELASGDELRAMQARMGGDFGYLFPYVDNDGVYTGHRNLGRETLPIAADAPQRDGGAGSTIHGCNGQNVLFGDGRVVFLTTCWVCEQADHMFENALGHVGAGIGENDAVLGRSADRPTVIRVDVPQE